MSTSEINDIKSDIKLIKENHLSHLELDMASVKTNMDWLMKWHWVITTASIGGLIAGIINMIK